MKTPLQIAWRNLLRQKRRTILSGITIAMAMVFFSMMDSMMTGMDELAIKNLIDLSTSAVKLSTTQYFDEKETFPLQYGLDSLEQIISYLKRDSRVTSITPRTMFSGQLSNYTDMTPVIGTVIDPFTDSTVFTLVEHIHGNYFSDNNKREIILGKDLAKEMGVSLDDQIILYGLTKYETRNADEFTVVGILNTTDPMINRTTAMITFSAAEEFLDLEGLTTELNVALKNRVSFKQFERDMKAVQNAVSAQFPELKVLTFNETAEDLRAMVEQKKSFSYVFLIALLFIAAVGIFNTVLMSVFERVREIGVLRAHGMRPGELMLMFSLEGVMTGIVGAIIGFITSLFVVWLLVEYGYSVDSFEEMSDSISGIPYWGTFYGVWNIPTIVGSGIFSIVISTLAAIIPARKAAKMSVVDALHFN